MNKFVVALAACGAFASPIFAAEAILNPFAGGDYGKITLYDGTVAEAALPAVTFDNYAEVMNKLNVTFYTIGDLPHGGVQLVINECTGVDFSLANAQPFLFFGHVSQLIVCGNELPPGVDLSNL